jgi:putative DNA primase/helicase
VTQQHDHPHSDLGNARRLIDANGDDLRYVPGAGWYCWAGNRWRADRDGEVLRRAAMIADRLYLDALAVTGDDRKRLVAFALASQGVRRLEAAVSLAEVDTRTVLPPDALDRAPDLLAVANGVVDLRTGQIKDADRKQHLTAASPIEYHPDAVAPRWDRFVAEVLPDPELAGYLQRLVGYSLTGHTREHVVAILHGAGANGKSVLVDLIDQVLGPDLAVAADFETFLGGSTAAYDLARFRAARLVTASESARGRHLDARVIKQATGGDLITARHPYGRPFTYKPQFTLALVTNHKPRVDANDAGLWRRLALVPFEQSFLGREDRHLPDRLRDELPGILRWAVAGAVDWYQHGLNPPTAITTATGAYRAEEDTVGQFIADRCAIDDTARVTVAELRAAYEEWCHSVGERPLANRELAEALQRRGIQKYRTKAHRGYQGLRVTPGDAMTRHPQASPLRARTKRLSREPVTTRHLSPPPSSEGAA